MLRLSEPPLAAVVVVEERYLSLVQAEDAPGG
jgi:hypothetical protein